MRYHPTIVDIGIIGTVAIALDVARANGGVAKPRPTTRAFWIKISIRASVTNSHPSVRARDVERTRSTHSPLRELNALKHTPRRSFAPIALAVYDVRTRVIGESVIFPHHASRRVVARRRVVVVPLVAVRLVAVRALAHNAYVVVEQARAFIVVVVVVVSNAVHRLDREREVNVIDVRGG
jgi:hypothetical protein